MAEKYYSEIKDVHLSSTNYVLVLPGWYPTWQDPFLGDFNQRHVNAAGLQTPQVVLYIVKDQSKTLREIETRFQQVTGSIVEITVMYPEKKNKVVDNIHSNLGYVHLLFKYAEAIKRRWGKPLLIHSYIVIRGGVGGILLGKRWNLPFILSENWTIYYPSDPFYLAKRNFLFRWIVKKVFKNVTRFLPVTKSLNEQVNNLLGFVPSAIVPNVVETNLFSLKEDQAATKLRFIHVSTMSYQKNPEGLLRSFKRFSEFYAGCSLLMVGPYPDEVFNYARSLGLGKLVHFTGPVSYKEVAEYVASSHILVLFSRYENLPCVILEALCCGLPVISTSVGGISEVIDASNGILVENENEGELIEAFTHMYNNYTRFDRKKISEKAKGLYSYSAVGALINRVYRELNSSHLP